MEQCKARPKDHKYGLLSFLEKDTKLEIILAKNQHTQRQSLNFDNWSSGKLSKIGHLFRQ